MSFLNRFFPTQVTRYVRFLAWLTFSVQIGIVVTGGAVRLTASGLGCPQWPTCDGSSIVTTPEMGVHGLIEFGNRLLTFVLVLVAIAAFLAVVRQRKTQPELFWLTLAIGLGIPAQAVIGGISVLMKLNPYVVGLHFVVSIAMVVLSTLFVERTRHDVDLRAMSVTGGYMVLGWLIAAAQFVTIIVGILTTGSGPHSGDAQAPRNGLDSLILERVHSIPAYLAVGLAIVLLVLAAVHRTPRIYIPVVLLLAVNALQIVVGISQSNMGLPVVLVGLHMLLACLVAAATTHVMYRLYRTNLIRG